MSENSGVIELATYRSGGVPGFVSKNYELYGEDGTLRRAGTGHFCDKADEIVYRLLELLDTSDLPDGYSIAIRNGLTVPGWQQNNHPLRAADFSAIVEKVKRCRPRFAFVD